MPAVNKVTYKADLILNVVFRSLIPVDIDELTKVYSKDIRGSKLILLTVYDVRIDELS